MNMKMQSVGFKADNKLEAFINQKITKLQRFSDNITGCEVFLNLEKSDSQDNKVVEIRMGIPGQELFAKKQCKTFEEATDLVTDALRTQIIKHKERIQAK